VVNFFCALKKPMAFNPEDHSLPVSRDRFVPRACTFLLAAPVLVVHFVQVCALVPPWNPGREPGGGSHGIFRQGQVFRDLQLQRELPLHLVGAGDQ
jgi:hypothetical protein